MFQNIRMSGRCYHAQTVLQGKWVDFNFYSCNFAVLSSHFVCIVFLLVEQFSLLRCDWSKFSQQVALLFSQLSMYVVFKKVTCEDVVNTDVTVPVVWLWLHFISHLIHTMLTTWWCWFCRTTRRGYYTTWQRSTGAWRVKLGKPLNAFVELFITHPGKFLSFLFTHFNLKCFLSSSFASSSLSWASPKSECSFLHKFMCTVQSCARLHTE